MTDESIAQEQLRNHGCTDLQAHIRLAILEAHTRRDSGSSARRGRARTADPVGDGVTFQDATQIATICISMWAMPGEHANVIICAHLEKKRTNT